MGEIVNVLLENVNVMKVILKMDGIVTKDGFAKKDCIVNMEIILGIIIVPMIKIMGIVPMFFKEMESVLINGIVKWTMEMDTVILKRRMEKMECITFLFLKDREDVI